jgi:thymidylate synthase (FAD)
MQVALMSMTHEPEKLIYLAGRTTIGETTNDSCNDPEAVAKWIKKRIAEGHESVLEHASATFFIKGLSRVASHQLVRHRIASYTQKSQRYVEDDVPEFVVPRSIQSDKKLMQVYQDVVSHAVGAYKEMRKHMIPKEDARFCLPGGAATDISVTMNFRALREFFKKRCSKEAQWEIRAIAEQMREMLAKHAPAVFEQ